MEEDISPTSLNVTAENSSKFKLVVNAYGCFVESNELNEGHKITKRLQGVSKVRSDCKLYFEQSI